MDINNLTTASTEELHADLLNCAKAAADPTSPYTYIARLHGSIARMAAELQRRDLNHLLDMQQRTAVKAARLFADAPLDDLFKD